MIMRKRRKALEDEEEEGEEDRAVRKPRSGEKGKEVQVVKIVAADGHVNFFSDLQTGVSSFNFYDFGITTHISLVTRLSHSNRGGGGAQREREPGTHCLCMC